MDIMREEDLLTVTRWLKPEARYNIKAVVSVIDDTAWSAAFYEYEEDKMADLEGLCRHFITLREAERA
jgi:hypothetical protein